MTVIVTNGCLRKGMREKFISSFREADIGYFKCVLMSSVLLCTLASRFVKFSNCAIFR